MLRKAILRLTKGKAVDRVRALVELFSTVNNYCQPTTTIILEARDSFELRHVFDLLQNNDVPVYGFMDTEQPDYGSLDAFVMTAIATEPVTREDVEGMLDYLPLWGSQYVKKL